jgi:asparagine synthase (glutamine-hydrolysing)
MCGISGLIDPTVPILDREAVVGRMCDAMAHRGPDDLGIVSRQEITLGMRRLAIFDPANGHQPMQTPDGRFTVVFNGAIYNFRALRTELASHGWAFHTECDTEVLLAAYGQWGEGCLSRLRGMFAFAAWDARERTLFLARDPFGIKPLYYRHDGERLLFASEINALLAARAFGAEIDPVAVGDYLAWFAVPAPRTIYRGVFSLRPGECATWRRGQIELRSAWSFSGTPSAIKPCASQEEFISELRAHLDDSIRAHMLADVPVGAFLSGGLDSAVVVGLMTQAGGARLKTFSIDFEERGYSEAASAEATAQFFGTEHQARILTGREAAQDIEKLLASYDQPTGDGVNTYYVSQMARAGGVKVALSGLGGDELFGGYPSFRNLPRISRWLPAWNATPKKLQSAVIARLQRGDTRLRKLADFLLHAHNVHELAAMQRRVFSESHWRSLLGQEALAASSAHAPFHPELASLQADLAGASSFEIASAWELRTYMPDVLLRDSDVMSMRHSLELRVPFVDRPFIEWLWRQPTAYKYTPRHPKDALAEAVGDVLPPHIRRRRKHGFTLPFAIWMRGELKPFLDETFSDASVERSGLFQREAVQSLWQGFLRHEDAREWSRVWSLAVLVAFTRRRIPAEAPAPPPLEISPVRPRVETAATPAPARKAGRGRRAEPVHFDRQTLLLAPELFSSVGGIPRILQLYLKALCELGAENQEGVRLVALNDPALDTIDLRRYTNEHLDNWYVCNRNKRRFVRATLKLARGCQRVVCGHVAQLPVAWAARWLNPGLRYYLVAHGIEVWRSFTLAERIALRGATRIFCVSDYTRRELLKNCPLPEGRAIVVPNALDPFFKIDPGEPLADCPPVILTVTRLTFDDRYKGVEDLIAAMPAVRAAEPAAQLRIIGRGDDLPRLQAIARKLGLLDKGVEFLGFVDDKHLDAELRRCRLFALPSKKEGFGLVFLEAMAHGRPCLGARAGGVPEVITDDTGVLVEFGNVPKIAEACVAALRGPWREQAILDRAELFSYQHLKQRLGSLLQP